MKKIPMINHGHLCWDITPPTEEQFEENFDVFLEYFHVANLYYFIKDYNKALLSKNKKLADRLKQWAISGNWWKLFDTNAEDVEKYVRTCTEQGKPIQIESLDGVFGNILKEYNDDNN